MKKALMIATILLLGALGQANAQIYLDYEDMNNNRGSVNEGDLPFVPELGLTTDQYAPVGTGIAVLGLLGGAYLLGKRKEK